MHLSHLQLNLPWSDHYSAEFKADPRPHKAFAHAFLHVQKALGNLAAMIDDIDHRREAADDPDLRLAARFIADGRIREMLPSLSGRGFAQCKLPAHNLSVPCQLGPEKP